MYGDIKVTTTKTRTFADYVTRTFIVEKVKLDLCETNDDYKIIRIKK